MQCVEIKESLSPEKYGEFTSGCKNGYKTIIPKNDNNDYDDDEFNDYYKDDNKD